MKKVILVILAAFQLMAVSVCAVAQGNASFSEKIIEADKGTVTATPESDWSQAKGRSFSEGTAISAKKPGAALEYDFNGVAVAADVLGDKFSGMVSVSVDGKQTAVLDLYRLNMDSDIERVLLAGNLAPGAHKLRIEVLADKNPKSLGSIITIDTLRVADAQYGSISGVIECRYNTGMPVMRAKAMLTGKDESIDVITGPEGTFSFGALAPETYSLRFEHYGFDPIVREDMAVAAGQQMDLGKVLLEEKVGARPLTFIREPIGVRPVIVRPGDEFPIEVAAPADASGWQVSLESQWGVANLDVKGAAFDAATGRWTVKAAAPAGTASFLYGLRLKFSGGEDFQPRAVDVVSAFKNSIRVVHLTDVHVYKSEALFEKYADITEEVNIINPDVIVVTGDLTDTNGYTDMRWPESDQYPAMLNLWNSFNAPTFIVPGNHDLSPYKYQDDYDRWKVFFDKTDFGFNVGPYHFAAFDDAYTMNSATKDAPYAPDVLPEQLDWLEKDLAANSGALMRVLLFHVPLHTIKSKVLDIAAKNDAKLALYGHVHLNQIDKYPGTMYVQTGAMYDGFYRVVNLENGKVGDMGARKDGILSFAIGAIKSMSKTSDDGRSLTVRVKNTTVMDLPGASWQAEMPTAADYSCEGCTVVSKFAKGDKTLVIFNFDLAAKADVTMTLTAK